MDDGIGRFLNAVRPRARAAHLPVYEEVALLLGGFLRRRRRTLRTVRAGELRGFLVHWSVRRKALGSPRDAHAFCAAVRVLVRFIDGERSPSRRLGPDIARAARDVVRAAHAAALLDDTRAAGAPGGRARDGYWQVALRGDAHVVVRDVRGGALVGPVPLPAPVVRALPAGAVLGMRLRASGGRWAVESHGGCYPAGAAPALRGERA